MAGDYAVLEVPDFPLAALLRRREAEGVSRPAARLEERTGQSLVAEANGPARECGVERGQRVGRALALCPRLALHERDAAAEAGARALLTGWAARLSPCWEEVREGVVAVDLAGRSRAAFVAETWALPAEAAEAGLSLRVGLADTPERAAWAARAAAPWKEARTNPDLYAGVSPAVPLLPAQLVRRMEDWGLEDLLAFVRLSREAVGRRLGSEGLRCWDELRGRRTRPLRGVVPAPAFRAEMVLDPPVETAEPALFVLRRLLEEVRALLERECRATRELVVSWRTIDRGEGERRIELAEAGLRGDRLFAPLGAVFGSVRTGAPLGYLALEAVPVVVGAEQGELFVQALRYPDRFAETLARLEGEWGSVRCGSPRPTPDHRPDGFSLVPPPAVLPAGGEAGLAGTLPERPREGLRRFRPAPRVRVRLEGERPVRWEGGPREGRIHRLRGPWVASGHWWEEETRWGAIEWDAQLEGGGVFRLVCRAPGRDWFLEGVYD